MSDEHSKNQQQLKEKVESGAKKIAKAKKERNSTLAQMAYLGTVGVIFILPVIVGAYFGVWLDNKLKGFSISWTISFIFIGIFIGAINVYLFLKE